MRTVKDMMAEADAAVERIGPDRARALMDDGALVLDVRDAPELAGGKLPGAVNISRGLLEYKADDTAGSHDPALRKDRPVLVYCAAGGRAALAGKLLKDMGYSQVYNIGGFKDWVAAGGKVEPG